MQEFLINFADSMGSGVISVGCVGAACASWRRCGINIF